MEDVPQVFLRPVAEASVTPAVSSLWHCPWPRPHELGPLALPGALPCGVRTFLPPETAGRRSPGPPAKVIIRLKRHKKDRCHYDAGSGMEGVLVSMFSGVTRGGQKRKRANASTAHNAK